MMKLSCDAIQALKGFTLATAESCTGGGIGAVLTAVPGSSSVYKGGIISYTNEVKISQLRVDPENLRISGAVSAIVAEEMAAGVRNALESDIGISVTGLAGPGGDEYGNPVGTVYIGYADKHKSISKHYLFRGDRDRVRKQAVEAALNLLLEQLMLIK